MSHADSELFLSLPGAGVRLAPRLLAELGDDRDRYESANSLQLSLAPRLTQ
ncbi:transposase [Reticulibacter mediterranei]|uniref:transposase n=1 Tax=Reticulibacter mediterranei TaxID=2778369 RepID=UPI001C68B79C|nr:transposase [Reticulibacter mediterranei]